MAIVQDYNITSVSDLTAVISYLENYWEWAGGKQESGSLSGIYECWLYLDAAKTKGLYFYIRQGVSKAKTGIRFKGNDYHVTEFDYVNINFKTEITETALIISYNSDTPSISASDCEKIIVCSGHNTNTSEDEQIMIYLGSKSSTNVSALYAGDVVTPANMSEQNANANTNARTTNLIPFYSTASEFITTDIFKSLCEDIGAWYFGNVMVNNKAYRMSGSVFALDE